MTSDFLRVSASQPSGASGGSSQTRGFPLGYLQRGARDQSSLVRDMESAGELVGQRVHPLDRDLRHGTTSSAGIAHLVSELGDVLDPNDPFSRVAPDQIAL